MEHTPFLETSQDSLALLYHISRELSAALELRTVLQRVLLLSMENVGANSGSIIVLDSQEQPVDSIIVYGERIQDQTTEQLRVTLEHGLAGWVLQNHQSVLILDTSHDERWLRRPDDAIDRTGAKSAISVPLLARERQVGVMTLVHPRPNSFNTSHLDLLETIADQAGITVLNARLYAESQRQARVMSALAEAAITVTGSLELKDVLQRILEQTSQALGIQTVSLALIDPQTNELVFQAATGPGSQKIIGIRLKIGEGIAGWVAKEGQGVIIPDVQKDGRFTPYVDHLTGYITRVLACAPIRSGDKVIGILEAVNPASGAFDNDALLMLTGIGSQAGTAIRHAQLFENLQAAHQRYHELFENSIDPILVTDLQGLILEANQQALKATGYASDTPEGGRYQLIGMNIKNIHKMKAGQTLKKMSSGVTSYESVLYTKQKSKIPIEVYAHPVNIAGGKHLQWILHDISERKRQEQLREDLIRMIYHDLRSPLSNVTSSLDMLVNSLPSEKNTDSVFMEGLLQIAQRAIDRIQRLTDSLLDVSRLEAGQPIVNQVATDIQSLIREAIYSTLPTIQAKGQTLTAHLPDGDPPGLPLVYIDADMILRVLINLIENASKYTPNGKPISVGAEPGSDTSAWVQVWVKDMGPGIPPEQQDYIFSKFARLSEHEDTIKGIGLGLAFCRLAIEGHGGCIWVESQRSSTKTGSRFVFTLPVAQDREQQAIIMEEGWRQKE